MSKGFFQDDKGQSMGRLLAFVSTITGIVIFAATSFIAVSNNQDIGSNVMYGAIFLVTIGVGGKTAQAAASYLKPKTTVVNNA